MKTNLTTGDVDFQLLLDFRPIINSTLPLPKTSTEGGYVKYSVNFPNGAIEATLSCSNPDVAFSPNPLTQDGFVTITIPSGATGTVYTITITYTYSNGTTSTETFNIFQ